jgi:hypothetical protein
MVGRWEACGRSKRAVVSLSCCSEAGRFNPCRRDPKSGVDAAVGGPSIAKRRKLPRHAPIDQEHSMNARN